MIVLGLVLTDEQRDAAVGSVDGASAVPAGSSPLPVGIPWLRRCSGCGTEGENPGLGLQLATLEASTRGASVGGWQNTRQNVHMFSFFPDN